MDVERVRTEIESLHEFFVAWFGGSSPSDDDTFAERFSRRFAPGFHLVPPGGQLLALDPLAASIHEGFGRNPGFRIAIREVRIHRASGGLVLATYQEWQRHAVNAQPPDNGRVASVLFVETDVLPSGLHWLHVHETWLPRDVMARGPYDF